MSDQTTNDEQAGYTTEPKREPMLSDGDLLNGSRRIEDYPRRDLHGAAYRALLQVRDFYEAKITSGELMVVKLLDGTGLVNMIPVREWKTSPLYCDDCGTAWMQKKGDCYTDEWEDDSTPCFCPGCGAKIVEA